MNWDAFKTWFLSLGAEYGVNPLIFGGIYVAAIPFFILSIGWLVRRQRAQKSITVPALCAGACFVSAYVYLAIAGRNIPIWVWIFIAALIAYGVWSTLRDIRRKTAAAEHSESQGK
jgi:hypothetical protein